MNKIEKKTGIELEAQKITIISPRTKVHGLSFFVLFLFFQAGLFGFFYSFVSAFQVEYQDNVLFWGIIVLGIVLWGLYYIGKIACILIPLAMAAAGVWSFLNFAELKNEVLLVINVLRNAVNQYFVTDLRPCEVDPLLGNDVTFLLILALILVGVVLFWGLVVRVNRPLAVLVTIWPTLGAMMVGVMPSFWSLSLLMFCYIGAFSVGRIEFRYRKKTFPIPQYYKNGVTGYSALLMGVITFSLFCVAFFAAAPQTEKISSSTATLRKDIQNNDLMERVRDAFPRLRLSMSGAGQIDSGELGGSVFFTGEEALQITLDSTPKETMYLKGYTGRKYTGKRWNKDKDSDFFTTAGEASLNEEGRRKQIMEVPFLMAGDLEAQVGSQGLLRQTVIERKAASADTIYVPYVSKETANESKNAYAFSFYERGGYVDLLSLVPDRTLDSVNEWVPAYRQYVYENYLDYPKESLPRLKALCDQNPLDQVSDIQKFVTATVSGSAKYNLKAGKNPIDKDFVEYFMFESHEGYCVHFASAAVLMFRMYGIPARYAAGYIAPESEFTNDPEGKFVAHIKDEKAHAWAEIYIDGQGWMPVETTPGYSVGVNTMPESNQNETEKITEPVTDQVQGQSEAGKQDLQQTEPAGKSGADGSRGILPNSFQGRFIAILLAIVILLLLLTLTLYIRRHIILQKRNKAGIPDIFVGMYEAMVLGGLSKKYDGMESNFPDIVVQRFPGIDKRRFSEIMELVLRANYGEGSCTQEDYESVQSMYHEVCKEVYSRLSGAEKLEFKFVKVFE